MQVFPSKGKTKNNTVQVSFVGKNACFFFFFFLMYRVDSGHLHFTSKKIPVCGIKNQNIGADRSDPDQTAPNYEQTDQGLHCFAIPPASITGICIYCNKKGR